MPIPISDLKLGDTLARVVIDDPAVVELLGDSFQFYTKRYFTFAEIGRWGDIRSQCLRNDGSSDMDEFRRKTIEFASQYVMDADGNPIGLDAETMPNVVMDAALCEVVNRLGKSSRKLEDPEGTSGNSPGKPNSRGK